MLEEVHRSVAGPYYQLGSKAPCGLPRGLIELHCSYHVVWVHGHEDRPVMACACFPQGLGMLAVLDSQCKFPRATDSTLHLQLLEALGARTHFGTNPRVPGSFIIRHYAGAVQYDTTGLLDKNKDTLSTGMSLRPA